MPRMRGRSQGPESCVAWFPLHGMSASVQRVCRGMRRRALVPWYSGPARRDAHTCQPRSRAQRGRTHGMAFLVVLAALVFLMLVAYRGYSVILFAPVAALGAVLLTDPAR